MSLTAETLFSVRNIPQQAKTRIPTKVIWEAVLLKKTSHYHVPLSLQLAVIHLQARRLAGNVHGALCIVHCAVCTVQGALCRVHCAWCTVQGAPCRVHCAWVPGLREYSSPNERQMSPICC
jgi:hypothetical protein